MPSSVPSFATRRLPDLRTGLLPGVFISYFVGMHYPAFLGGRAAAARSQSLCNFYILLYLFEMRTVLVERRLGYLAMSQGF